MLCPSTSTSCPRGCSSIGSSLFSIILCQINNATTATRINARRTMMIFPNILRAFFIPNRIPNKILCLKTPANGRLFFCLCIFDFYIGKKLIFTLKPVFCLCVFCFRIGKKLISQKQTKRLPRLRQPSLYLKVYNRLLLSECCASVECFHVDRNEVVLSLRKDLEE